MTTTSKPVSAPRIRTAASSDLPSVERLLVASGLPVEGVRAAFANFVVAEAGGEIVGVAGLELCCDNALLRSVAVADDWRKHGVGRALVTRLISDAEARGIRALYLLTTTAEGYFPSFGFHKVARADVPKDVQQTTEFSTVCCASAAVMCRECAAA